MKEEKTKRKEKKQFDRWDGDRETTVYNLISYIPRTWSIKKRIPAVDC